MDPRKPDTYNPGEYKKKRGPSQSPEGNSARKALKPNPKEGVSTPTTDHSSRRSSTSTAPPRALTSPVSVPAELRRTQAQLQTALRRETESNAARSPDKSSSTSAQHENASINSPSGRLPPRAESTSVKQAQEIDTESTRATNPVVDLLMNFTAQVTKTARLELSRDQAEARVKRANLEYESMANKFTEFPIIKSQKTHARTTAQKDFNLKEGMLQEHTNIQKQLAEKISYLFGQQAEVEPAAQSSANTSVESVSRADFDDLNGRFQELQQQFQAANKSISDMSEKLSSVEEGDSIQSREIEKFDKRLSEFKSQVVGLGKDVDNIRRREERLKDDVAAYNDRVTRVQNHITSLKEDQLRTMEESEKEHESTHRSLDQEILRLGSRMDVVTGAIYDLREAKPANGSITSSRDIGEPLSAEINKKIDQLSEDLRQSKNQIDQLWSVTMGDENDSSSTPVSSFKAKLHVLEEQIHTVHNTVSSLSNKMQNAMSANEKVAIEKQLKNLTHTVNNLHIETHDDNKAPILLRLSQLEIDYLELKKSLESAQDEPHGPLQLDGGRVSDLKRVTDRLNSVENLMNRRDEIDIERDLVEDTRDKLIGERASALEMQIAEVARLRSDDAQDIRATVSEVKAMVEEVKADVQKLAKLKIDTTDAEKSFKATVTALDGLRNEVVRKVDKGLFDEWGRKQNEMIKKAGTSSKTPTPGSQPFAAPPLHLLNCTSPSTLLNGVHTAAASSPQVNGVHQPNIIPQNLQFDLSEKFAALDAKDEALTVVTNRLQMQYNNLTTEDIVKQMVGQLSILYPDAKLFNQAAQELRTRQALFDKRLTNIHKEKEEMGKSLNLTIGNTNHEVRSAQKQADEAKTLASQAGNSAKSAGTMVRAAAENIAKVKQEMKGEFLELRREVFELEGKVRHHDSIFKPVENEVKEINKKIVTLGNHIAEGGAQIMEMERALPSVKRSSGTTQGTGRH